MSEAGLDGPLHSHKRGRRRQKDGQGEGGRGRREEGGGATERWTGEGGGAHILLYLFKNLLGK